MVFESVIEKESRVEYQVEATRNGENPQPCPVCSQDRKKKKDKCFSYNTEKQSGRCSHCDRVFYKKRDNEKAYTRPEWSNKTTLSDKLVDWFLSRNINQDTLNKMRVTESREYFAQVNAERNCINFNYFRNGQLINVKYRDGEKNFKLFKDAEKIFYNLDGIKDQKEIYIVEGEMDCLTMVQQGFTNTVSVPNGATKGNNKLDYLDNCYQFFEDAEKVYILTDHDEPGDRLGVELARRIGVEKCWRIHLGEFKDVNEQFCKTGKLDLSDSIAFPITGIYGVEDHWNAMMDILKNGFPQGWKPRGTLAKHLSFHPGYKTIITGIPGHGKSEVLDQILLQLCIDYNLRGGFFTPENWPSELHLIKLVEKVVGKNAWKCTAMELDRAKKFLTDRIFWVYPEEGYTLDSILGKMRQAVLKFGINWYVIDPWNKIEHQYSESETKYISESLDKIANFNQKNGTHSFIVAHPTKMKFNHDKGCYEMPGLYDISGSANFYNKADIGITIYKDPDVQFQNLIAIQKVKFKFWGEIGQLAMRWNQENGRYDEYGIDLTYWLKEQKAIAPIDFTAPKYDPNDETPF
jgi:twinkle protein